MASNRSRGNLIECRFSVSMDTVYNHSVYVSSLFPLAPAPTGDFRFKMRSILKRKSLRRFHRAGVIMRHDRDPLRSKTCDDDPHNENYPGQLRYFYTRTVPQRKARINATRSLSENQEMKRESQHMCWLSLCVLCSNRIFAISLQHASVNTFLSIACHGIQYHHFLVAALCSGNDRPLQMIVRVGHVLH